MKALSYTLFLVIFVGCEKKPISSTKQPAVDPIVGLWARDTGTRFMANGTIQSENELNAKLGVWRRLEGRIWRFTFSDETLEAVNSREILAPLTPSYTLSELEPSTNEYGTWSPVQSGGFYETAPEKGRWEEGLKFTLDGDVLIESQGDYSNHYERIPE